MFNHLEILEKDYFGLQYCATENRSQFNQKFLNSHLLLKNFNLNSSHSSNLSSQSQSQNEPQEVWVIIASGFFCLVRASAVLITFLSLTTLLFHLFTIFQKWLDTGKSIKHQFRSDPPYRLFFRVRFYVSDPTKLQEENTRFQFFLQLRNDILDGKLICTRQSLVKLGSYTVQSELGDYNAEEHRMDYLRDLELVPNQDSSIEQEIAQLHRLISGQTPEQAENNFLQHAKTLDTYGIEMHRAKDETGKDISIGVGSTGIVVFERDVKVNAFVWSKIVKLSFKSKYFYVQLRRENHTERYEAIACFNLLSYRQCKRLWKCCVQNHTFFRLQTPKPQCKKLFFFLSLGSRFRYSGRTEFQALEESRTRVRPHSNFSRTPSKRYARQTMPSFLTSQPASARQRSSNDLSATSSIHDLEATDSPSADGRSFWRNGLSFKLLNNLSSSVMKRNMRSLTKLNGGRKSNGSALINSKLVTSTSNSELKMHRTTAAAADHQPVDSSSNYRLTDSGRKLSGSNSIKNNGYLNLNSLLPIRREESTEDDKLSTLNSINKSMHQKNSSPSHQSSAASSANLISSLKSVSNTSKITESSTQLAKEAWIEREERWVAFAVIRSAARSGLISINLAILT